MKKTTEHTPFNKKIDEIIDWINKHDEKNKMYEKLIEKSMKMKEEEHKQVMEFSKVSMNMMKKVD